MEQITAKILVAMTTVVMVSGHGRMVDPPQRSSAWRFGYNTPKNYNDNELNCGGFANQWSTANDGRCGVCGDPYQAGVKENEDIDGIYATGTITGNYVSNGDMTVKIDITAYHKGWFEFRLCKLDSPTSKLTQECLNRTLLREKHTGLTRIDLKSRKTTQSGSGRYTFTLALPEITCSNCVLQWWYNTGNSYGCEQAGCGVGLGKQESFVNCADIKIIGNDMRPSSVSVTQSTTLKALTSTSPSSSSTYTQSPTKKQSTHTQTKEESSTHAQKTESSTTHAQKTEPSTTQAQTTKSSSVHEQSTTKPVVSSTDSESDASQCTCEGTGAYKNIQGIAKWCCQNCALGYCPPTHCKDC